MNRVHFTLIVLASATFGSLYAMVRLRSELPATEEELVIIEGSTKHIVTPEMAGASRAMLDRPAPNFSKAATDGKTYRLEEMLRNGLVILTFVKEGCPCSDAAQPFFNELHAAYPRVSIRGVINVAAEPAKRWADKFHVTYPLLLDPNEELVRDYGVENSAYVVLIGSNGEIAKHWPGYSESMLRELGSLTAKMTGSPEKSLSFADAPTDLYTGCPYDL
ncbi:Peroxiredoxin [Singulisphaera sp. GP187]|uniref:peroxiredoxin family protein n=1 Tax=Singulisphaera sp. GP187 TaxID=1882752 RepID=UPI0009268695|nr:redoxin domain-containing protein [Singulisphaera sp. GP187]SIO59536.1 Peroxiredoxin [Singulisphaera sp. GP187]